MLPYSIFFTVIPVILIVPVVLIVLVIAVIPVVILIFIPVLIIVLVVLLAIITVVLELHTENTFISPNLAVRIVHQILKDFMILQ